MVGVPLTAMGCPAAKPSRIQLPLLRVMVAGVAGFAAEVRRGDFPGPEHTYSIDDEELQRFQAALAELV